MPASWRRFHVLAVLPLLALGCGRDAPAGDETAPPAPVKWMEARQLFIAEWTEIIGTTQPLPDCSARVTAAVEGHVVSVLQDASGKPIAEGQRVKKGDVLVRLYDQIARNTRDKVAADLEVSKQLTDQAKLNLELAEIDVQRFQELKKRDPGLASPVELAKAKLGVEDANSKLKGAKLGVDAKRVELKALDDQLDLYTLRAPISGRLGRILVVQGQTLAVGTPVAEILDLDKEIDLLCFVPPSIRNKLRDGQQVQIGTIEELAGWPGKPDASGRGKSHSRPPGSIVYVADQAELDTGNFAVKVRFPNDLLRMPGSITVRAQVLTTPGRAALTLPESALMADQDPPAVIVVENEKTEKNKEGKETETGVARKLQARIGIRDRILNLVEILGLEDAEKKWHGSLDTAKFVIEKGHGLKTGDPIRLEEEDEEAPSKETGS
jgi:RND family efflux transporter MFP subunit